MFDINNKKRNQAMSLRGRAVGSDVVIFHAETNKALSFLRLRGASGAQGISAPALCREAHKRHFLLNPWILRFANASLRMTIPTLAFLLSLNISTSWAINCPAGTQGSDNVTDSNSCGANCCWGIDPETKVLTITPALDDNGKAYTTVNMKNFSFNESNNNESNGYTSKYSSTAPWARQGVTSVVVENGIRNIGDKAFMGDTKITSVTGMKDVISVGNYAFSKASSLADINLTNVSSINDWAFSGATSLTSVNIPNVTTISEGVFTGATSLANVDLTNVTSVKRHGFSSTALTNVDIPNVTSIGEAAFSNINSLTSVDMPNVETIGVSAFANDTSLNYVGLPATGVSIHDTAFGNWRTGKGEPLSIMSSCDSSSGYQVCTTCTSGQVYKQGTGCASASECGEGYTDNGHGLCKKNPTQVAQNTTPQGGSGNTGGTSTGGDVSGDFNPADCYNNGQVPYDNKCWDEYPFAKKRWTPAEAAEWLHDGNDNFVVITFKK
jgi:hypothetical protein